MPSELAYKIADDIVKALFTNGAKQKASRLVLELAGGRNGGGWSYRPARDHVADVVEKHLASIGAVEQGVQSDLAVCALDHDKLAIDGHSTCPNCGAIPPSR